MISRAISESGCRSARRPYQLGSRPARGLWPRAAAPPKVGAGRCSLATRATASSASSMRPAIGPGEAAIAQRHVDVVEDVEVGRVKD